MNHFVPRIILDVSPEIFVFTQEQRSISLDTYLYVDATADGLRVAAVGERPATAAPALIRVDLFREAALPTTSRPIEKMECLEPFVRYALQKLKDRRNIVRPIITVRHASALAGPLGGYHRAVLREAFEAAGAQEVVFV